MKLFILPPSLGRYKYKVHGGPFLGEHNSTLKGVSINEASIFEEDMKYVSSAVLRYGQFSNPISLLNEFVINKIDKIHAKLQSRADDMCLTYNQEVNGFYKNSCSEDIWQVFTEIPYEKYKEYERLSKMLIGKNRYSKRLQAFRDPNNWHPKFKRMEDEEKGKKKSNEIKHDVIANYLRNQAGGLFEPHFFNEELSRYLKKQGVINPITHWATNRDILTDTYLNTLIDFKTKAKVKEEIERIEQISKGEHLLNNRNSPSLINGFKEKQSELIPFTLRALEYYEQIF